MKTPNESIDPFEIPILHNIGFKSSTVRETNTTLVETLKIHALSGRTFIGPRKIGHPSRWDGGFTLSNLIGAKMREGVFAFQSFRQAIMVQVKMQKGNFAFCSFRYADLTGARANNAKMWGADFTAVTAPGARFKGAQLNGAKISGNFTNADFRGADLRGYFNKARNTALATDFSVMDPEVLKTINFEGAIINKHTVFPPGFDTKKAGMRVIDDENDIIPGHSFFFNALYKLGTVLNTY